MSVGTSQARTPLSREHVLAGALSFVDEHGLDALSMHKLGAELGVTAMSLYKHVANKDDLLDGIVELLWTEVPVTAPAGDWRAAIRQLATALRALVHRHPTVASLLISRQAVQERLLWICHGQLDAMRAGGVPEQCAVALLRAVLAYGIGYGLAELSMPRCGDADTGDEVARVRRVADQLSPQAPDDLVRVALLVCGGFDAAAQFDIGLGLMIRGMDAYLATDLATD